MKYILLLIIILNCSCFTYINKDKEFVMEKKDMYIIETNLKMMIKHNEQSMLEKKEIADKDFIEMMLFLQIHDETLRHLYNINCIMKHEKGNAVLQKIYIDENRKKHEIELKIQEYIKKKE